jgi:hypothetical protein
MVVLAVLACLMAAMAIFYVNVDDRLNVEISEIFNDCEKIKEGTEEWTHKCSYNNNLSDLVLNLDAQVLTHKRLAISAKYTGYILLLMLISGVLRWIWNGRKSNQ